jgi:transposase
MQRKDIADKYGVHEDTVYYWLKKYKIRIKKVGRPRFSKLINID